jgi:uncharacterized cupredoxin-like copper-binding protein
MRAIEAPASSPKGKHMPISTIHRRDVLASVAVSTVALASLGLGARSAAAHGDKTRKSTTESPLRDQKPWGIAGVSKAVRRTIVLRMTDDMRFTPDMLDIALNETVKLMLRNHGKVLHELVIGTKAELEAHAALMLKFPGMEHDEPYMAHVQPGKTGQIIWQFNRAGEFDFACLIAGHYQAGMVGKIHVAAR